MDWYYYIAVALILSELVLLLHALKSYRYAISKYRRRRSSYQPCTSLIVPCKDLETNFSENITSFFEQDFDDYSLWFVVAERTDPAYSELDRLKAKLSAKSKAKNIQILIAGKAETCSQKLHNLLHCYKRIGNDVRILAFADSDIRVR